MREIAAAEESTLTDEKAELEEKIKWLLYPKTPEDARDVILEIRSGTGGDEASILPEIFTECTPDILIPKVGKPK